MNSVAIVRDVSHALQVSSAPSELDLRLCAPIHSAFPTTTVEWRGSAVCVDTADHVFATLRVETHCQAVGAAQWERSAFYFVCGACFVLLRLLGLTAVPPTL